MPGRTGPIRREDIARVRIIRPLAIETARKGRFYHGKMYLRPGSYLFEGMHRAQRVFIKRISYFHGETSDPLSIFDRENAQKEIEIRHQLKRLGLPVPKSLLWEVKSGKNRGIYLVTESFLRGKEKKSKLQALNPYYAEPDFLKKLNIENENDRKLVSDLARATATMLNHGIISYNFDFFGIYPRKDGKWNYQFMDTSDLERSADIKTIRDAKHLLLESVQKGSGTRSRYDFWTMEKHTIYGLFDEVLEKHLRPELK